MTETTTYSVTVNLTSQNIADLMVTAFEGGITYWCSTVEEIQCKASATRPWYSDPEVWEGPFVLKFHDRESDEAWELTPEKLQEGLRLSAASVISNIVEDNADADDADHVLQMALFGKLVFG